VSGLQTRIDRLERLRNVQVRSQQHTGRPTMEDHFNALTTPEEREAFIALVQEVHAVQEREHTAAQAGQAIPPRSTAEQARIDELDRHCIEINETQ